MNRFVFRAVGQGLFYTGSIANGEFKFVYDCGTNSKQKYIKREIEIFDREEPNKDLEFVIISHLHSDHFNGLPLLIKKFNIEKLYLPYLPPSNIIKMFLLIYGCMDEESRVDWSLFNTMSYFYKLNNNDDKLEHNIEPAFLEKLIKIKVENDCSAQKIESRFDWKFKMFNKTIPENQVITLEKKLESCLKKDKDFYKRFLDLKLTLKDLNRIRDIYEVVFKKSYDLNKTSTILIHYPVKLSVYQLVDTPLYYEHCRFCHSFPLPSLFNATLLTGDAEIDEELYNKIIDIQSDFVVFQIPHHGSSENWNERTRLLSSKLFVMNCGNNNPKHPAGRVVLDLLDNQKCFTIVSQEKRFAYNIEYASLPFLELLII